MASWRVCFWIFDFLTHYNNPRYCLHKFHLKLPFKTSSTQARHGGGCLKSQLLRRQTREDGDGGLAMVGLYAKNEIKTKGLGCSSSGRPLAYHV
jgi:hypothetical protein